MLVSQRLVIGPNKPTPFAVLAVRRKKKPVTKHGSYIESKEFSSHIYDQSSDFTESYGLKCQHFPPLNLCYDAAKEKW